MKKIIILTMMCFLCLGCSSNNENKVDKNKVDEKEEEKIVMEKIEGNGEAVYTVITPETAKDLMNEDSIVLDVRTKEEFDQGHIENALLLPVDNIQNGDYGQLIDKNQVILVYCRSGNRSATAAKALVKAGYKKVFDFGGIIDWPYDIVK